MAELPKSPYVVTDVAGPNPKVAGKNREIGETVYLTADQAQHEVSRGIVIAAAKRSNQNAGVAGEGAPAGEPVAKFSRRRAR